MQRKFTFLSEAAAKRVYESLGNYLTRKLRLVVNHQMSNVQYRRS